MNARDPSARGLPVRVRSQSTVLRTAALLLAGALAACSGGGGGGGGGGGATGPLIYTGNTNPAVISTSNAAVLVSNILGGTDPSALISSLGSGADGGARDTARRLTSAVRAVPLKLNGSRLTSQPFDTGPRQCPGGGTERDFGDINASGTGTVNIEWINCVSGTLTLNGRASAQVRAFDPGFEVITDGVFTFERVSITTPNGTGIVSGTVHGELSIFNRTEITTSDLVTLNPGGKLTKTQGYKVTDVYNDIFVPTSITETIEGTLFDGTHGFVGITTNAPLVFDNLAQRFPRSGELVLEANNRRVRATAQSSTALRLALDTNGDGIEERTVTLAWTDLGGLAGSDLRDSDGDGMHDSWELAYGLRPDADDHTDDFDHDGFTNLDEYQAGTKPNDLNSKPGVASPPPPPVPGPVAPPPGPTPPPPPPPPPSPTGPTHPSSLPPVPAPLPAFNGPFPAAITGTVVNLANVTDLVYDPTRQRIYASVLGNPGTVVPIDPATGLTETPIVVGLNPVKLALSDDSQYLYAALDTDGHVARLDLATHGVNLSFAVGSDPFLGLFYVEDMQVLPGNPEAVAISRRNKGFSPRHAGVAVYDNGVPRGVTTPGHTGSNVIEFGSDAGTLYGYNNETTEFGFRTMTVNAAGVTTTKIVDSFDGDFIFGFGVDIRFAGGRIFTTTGRVIDPNVPAVVGTAVLPSTFGNFVVADANPAVNRAFYLTSDSARGTWTILAFDLSAMPPQPVMRQDISGVAGVAGSFIRWGAKGLAFIGSGQVILIESPNLIP